MHRRPTLSTSAVGLLGVVVLIVAGCGGSSPDATTPAGLTMVQQVRVEPNGDVTPVPDTADAPAAANPAGDGNAVCPPLSIAVAGPRDAGDGSHDGVAAGIQNGIQLAIDMHNAANPRCQVQLKPFDTGADAGAAAGAASQIVDDAYTVGLVGPASSAAAQTMGEVFNRAGLVAVTPAATRTALSENGWQTFFRGLASDGAQGAAAADYLTGTLGNRKVCVVEVGGADGTGSVGGADGTGSVGGADGTGSVGGADETGSVGGADETGSVGGAADGGGSAQVVRQLLGPVADPACNIVLKPDETEFSAAAQQITDARPDSVFYGGPAVDAAPFVDQLRERGFAGGVVGVDGTRIPPSGPFVEEYAKKFGTDPSRYSADGYDLGTILLKGIDSGAITRPAMLEFVRGYQGEGVVREYAWTDTGELRNADVWIYEAT